MSDDVDDLRNQTAQTREQLAQTVEALAHKADVKTRTREKLAETQQQKPWALPAAAGGLIAVVVAWIVVRRRK